MITTHEEAQALLNPHILPVGMAVNSMNIAAAENLGNYVHILCKAVRHPDGSISAPALGAYTLPNGEKGIVHLNSETLQAIANGQQPTWEILTVAQQEQPDPEEAP